jgi:hypothetical protein
MPFNSNATYNVLFREHDHTPAPSQIEAFGDTWHWISRQPRHTSRTRRSSTSRGAYGLISRS